MNSFFEKTQERLLSILASLILTAIIACERSGAIIHGIVCDGAQTNRGLWKHFGISANVNEEVQGSFENPSDPGENYKTEYDRVIKQRRIHFFSDVPHLFKCIRNNSINRKDFKVTIDFPFNINRLNIFLIDKNNYFVIGR